MLGELACDVGVVAVVDSSSIIRLSIASVISVFSPSLGCVISVFPSFFMLSPFTSLLVSVSV